jgi:hypothetical protein
MAKALQEEEGRRFHTAVARDWADKTRGSMMPSARSVCANSRGKPEDEEWRGFESCPRATTASTAIASTLGCPSNNNNNNNIIIIIGRRPLAPFADAFASSTTSAFVVLIRKKPL